MFVFLFWAAKILTILKLANLFVIYFFYGQLPSCRIKRELQSSMVIDVL